jgi:hypothetical protein
VFCWAGEREVREEDVGGGGKGTGGGDIEQDIFYESGWHALGVGPVTALHQIIQSGKVIFNGPISNESHPSGSTVDLGTEGSFQIYWGEVDQPINTFLGDAGRVTISSRWPHLCYVVWNKKRLSGSPVWPLLDYVVERRPSQAVLTGSQGWYEPGITASGDVFSIDDFVANSNEDIGYLETAGDQTSHFKANQYVEITGNGLPDGTYQVLRSEAVLLNPFVGPTVTRVYLQDGTLGADDNGTMEPYLNDDTDGANIAHVIAELLFANSPQGLQIDPNHIVERWDLTSLEELGEEAETDEWRASVLGSEAEYAEALLGSMLQDHGVMLPIDTQTGAMLFRRVRFPVGTLPALSDDIYADKLPEIETIHGEQPVDKLIYTFSDRSHAFGDMTIAIDEDGQASYMEHQRARKVPMVSTVQFTTAAKLSELRSPEELAHTAEVRIDAGREARDLIPGDAITAEGFDEVLRVISVTIDPLSERVGVRVAPDFYGARKSDFITGEGGGDAEILDPEQDELFAFIEVPEVVLGGFPATQTILIPRIRAHAQISSASLWLSRDNITYTLWGNSSLVQTGGTLLDEMSADGPNYIDEGPEYSELGPDNGTLTQDLSADLTNWGLGRQLCVIIGDGVEICFLQKASITGGGVRRLDGLARARYHTRKGNHQPGAMVFIFDRDAITPVQDALLEPGEDLYVKTQPGTGTGQVNLSAVPPYFDVLYGYGQVPIKPDYMYVEAPALSVPAYRTGDDITISWALSTGSIGTGAGFQSSGVELADPEIPGTVRIQFLTTGDVVVLTRTRDADITNNTLTNADLIAAFGTEPAAFKVRITHIANGQSSAVSPSLTITKVA